MKLTRRDFIKFSALVTGALSSAGVSFLNGCKSVSDKLKGSKQKPSICPFCSMGCGIIISVRQGQIVNIEGDPDHPINEGTLCAKGNAAFQLGNVNKKRLDKVKHRAPYAAEWKEITWDDAVNRIAKNIKDTRDKTFIENEGKYTANRTTGLAVMGGSLLTNEENYLLSKTARLLGIVYLCSEFDFSNLSAHAALSSTLGYGATTNPWPDIQRSDVILIIGTNPAESHPVSIKHILKAKEKGGKIIHIDPRFSRTSPIADYYAPIRPGTDIAFIGGIINYALQNNRFHREYLIEYTNAPYLINPEYRFHDGLFNGFKGSGYESGAWDYQRDKKGTPRKDRSLGNTGTVFQIMKAHFSRYTAGAVSSSTGCPAEIFLKIADIFTSSYRPDKAASILFSSGATQHTTGTQNVRAFAILQLLLGNIGIPGGGLNALGQGFNNGSADHGLQSNSLPGYLPAPNVNDHRTLSSYITKITPLINDPMSIDYMGRRRTHLVSLLKAFYGDVPSKENYFCYDWLPKSGKAYYAKDIFYEMRKGSIKGAIFAGANPALSAPNADIKIKALENLEWMLVSDIFESETSLFWKREGADPTKIKTEVFLFPSASPLEKDGSVTNSGRWVQWLTKASNPPGDARPDLWIFDNIFKKIKEIYKGDYNSFFPDPIMEANWNYSDRKAIDSRMVAKEINGYIWDTKKPVSGASGLKDDGLTAAGNWLYCGSFTETGNMMRRRIKKDTSGKIGIFSGWAWAWPGNTRILYNRASVDRKGKPWNPDSRLIKWDNGWEGDSTDGAGDFGPGEKNPFIMLPEGVAGLFARDIADGPVPEHYEPVESPARNIFNPIDRNPCVVRIASNPLISNRRYPYIATTYKIAEAWQTGIMSLNLPWLAELAPGFFCEISVSLAESLGLNTGDTARIISRRGSIKAFCIVTDRIRPFIIDGRKIEMIGIVMNSAHEGLSNNYNQLTHDFGDPNTFVPEYKAFLVNIEGI